jgi:hypothetical protein
MVIVSHVCLVFLLEGPTPTLSRDTWMIYVFSVVVHVPLDQMVRWKGSWRLLLIVWLGAGFLRFISLTPARSHCLVLCRWWTEAWRTCGSWILVAHVSWPESLYGSPTSPTYFHIFDSCGIWLVVFLCAWLVLVVITFLIAWTLRSHSWDLMNYLTPFHVSWDEFMNIFIELLCWSTTLFLWCFYLFFSYCSLEISLLFLLIAHILFLEIVFRHASKGDSTLFSNQTLHLVNPHDKLSTFVLYPSPRFSSIHQLTLWDLRLGHLSLITCRMEVLW